jgi:methyl-accepting chemotaxis protein
MTIPPHDEARLGIFGIDENVCRARAAVWRILQPHLNQLIREHLETSCTFAPKTALAIRQHYDRLVDVDLRYTATLFTAPFDKQWAADGIDRARIEFEMGRDMRMRAGLSHTLLNGILRLASQRHPFSTGKVAMLMNTAIRVLLMDVSTAIAGHHEVTRSVAKAEGDDLRETVNRFANVVTDVRDSIGTAITTLNDTSQQLAFLSESAKIQIDSAAAASIDTSSHVETTATAVEELSASIAEIHDRASRSATMAHQAVAQADKSNFTIRSLSEAVGRIGSVIHLISKIAAQTNLLALNAAIEAARAGEAGKGFAVVAAEVKSLANQTSKATEDIRQLITLIQEATHQSVAEIANAGKTVSDIAAIAETVAGAVHDQAAATESIAHSASHAASNASIVAAALKVVEETIRLTHDAAESVLQLSRQLSEGNGALDQATDSFLTKAQFNPVKELFATR